jgi:hypothetical protein
LRPYPLPLPSVHLHLPSTSQAGRNKITGSGRKEKSCMKPSYKICYGCAWMRTRGGSRKSFQCKIQFVRYIVNILIPIEQPLSNNGKAKISIRLNN